MRTKAAVVAVGIWVVLVGVSAACGDVISTWDDGSNPTMGWSCPKNTDGWWEIVLTVRIDDPDPSSATQGYLRYYDAGPGSTQAVAPPAYHANYLNFPPNSRFEWDSKVERTPAVFNVLIYIAGPGGHATYRSPDIPNSTWRHFTAPLEQSKWTVDSGSWSAILANVNYVGLAGDIVSGYGTYEGAVDNFTLIPEPATLALLGLGAMGLVRVRRK